MKIELNYLYMVTICFLSISPNYCFSVECSPREYLQIKDMDTETINEQIKHYKMYYDLNINGGNKLLELGDFKGSSKYADDASGCEKEIEKFNMVLKSRSKAKK